MEPRFLVMLPFEEQRVGPYESGAPHCTVMYWFSRRHLEVRRVCDFLDELGWYYLQGSGLTLVSKARADNFGPKGETAVYLLAENLSLIGMHHTLKQFLDLRHRCVHDVPAWSGEGYRPHVTITPRLDFEPGQIQTVRQLALLQETAGYKEIVWAKSY